MRSLLTLFIFTLPSYLYAQYGSIQGKVIDENTQEGIIGASILIEGTSQGVATDIEGRFELGKILPGTYSLLISSLGYQSQKLTSIVVGNEQLVTLEVSLQEAAQMMEAVVVRAARTTNTQSAVLSEIRNSAQVVSGVSQQQIKISQDRDAAQVLSRVPGVTIVDGRFVMVRGIPERYNQVQLNNAIAPSTEVDRRTFSFDLIPSHVLDRMLIFKSGSADNPGDFSGGLIKVYTSNALEDNFLSVTVSGGIRSGTTLEDYFQSKGSRTDFLGFDNGYRKLPSDFPTENLRDLPGNASARVAAAHSLKNNFTHQRSTALPDVGLGLTFGKSWHMGVTRLSTLTLANLSQSYSHYQRDFFRYLEQSDPELPVEQRFAYIDSYYEKENKISLLSNWNLNINAYNKINLKNLFNQIGENQTVLRNGEDFNQQVGYLRKNYMYKYRSRTIYSGQLEGYHIFPATSNTLNWVVGLNHLSENLPDLRRFRTIKTTPGKETTEENIYRIITPPSSNLYDTGRYFGKLRETGGSIGSSFEHKNDQSDDESITYKIGYLVDYRSRQFNTRYFSYYLPGSISVNEQDRLTTLPLSQIFSNENISANDGFRLEEGTRANDSYRASSFLGAGFINLGKKFGVVNLNLGVRGEYNILRLNTSSETGSQLEVSNRKFSPLIFINSDYDVTDNTKLRFAYNRTINRPEFREIAPFLFYDYEFDSERIGNPNLQTATIDNFDLRYEFYPRNGEMISLGAFYKKFTNPIETLILIRSESPGFSYQNAEGAFNYGVEFELQKSLSDLVTNTFLSRFSLNLNASYIYSRVNYGDDNLRGQEHKRALQGQSPYIVNTILQYTDEASGLQWATSYNVFGKRIFAVSSSMFPSIYELPRHSLDITITKNFRDKLSLKAGIQDVLNMRYRFYQDTNRDTRIDTVNDHPIFNYRRGLLFSASLTYTVK